ncbi:MAG: XisI protein [Candidatus Electrothrix sp.]
MDKITAYRSYVQDVIQRLGQRIPASDSVETQYIFDKDHDHYQLFQVGWDRSEWVHGCILHLDIKQGKIWVQHNGTELGIAEDLLSLGVPADDIVLGFQAPYKRKYTGFGEG